MSEMPDMSHIFPTREQMEAAQRAHEMEHMEAQAIRNDFEDWFNGLSGKDLNHVHMMLQTIVGGGRNMSAKATAYWFMGRLFNQIAAYREAEAITRAANSESDPFGGTIPVDNAPIDDEPIQSQELEDQLNFYEVTLTPRGTVVCRNCGTNEIIGYTWNSLHDRMQAAPGRDGCPGCQRRSAQG